jgi:hypothetical protein
MSFLKSVGGRRLRRVLLTGAYGGAYASLNVAGIFGGRKSGADERPNAQPLTPRSRPSSGGSIRRGNRGVTTTDPSHATGAQHAALSRDRYRRNPALPDPRTWSAPGRGVRSAPVATTCQQQLVDVCRCPLQPIMRFPALLQELHSFRREDLDHYLWQGSQFHAARRAGLSTAALSFDAN